MDVEVGVFIIIVIVIVVDEVHHFLVSAFALLNVHFPAPFIDCILEGVVDVVADILERITAGADRHLLGEEGRLGFNSSLYNTPQQGILVPMPCQCYLFILWQTLQIF